MAQKSAPVGQGSAVQDERALGESQTGRMRDELGLAVRVIASRSFLMKYEVIEELVDRMTRVLQDIDPGHKGVISISGEGTMGFSYEGRLAIDPKASIYAHTNEKYSQALLDAIAGASGITRYIGVLGSGDQHRPLIGTLQKGNQLSSVELVDTNPKQILAAAITFSVYNNSGGNADAHPELRFWPGFNYYDGVKLQDMKATLRVQSIEEAVAHAERGKHFIYMSNTVGMFTDAKGGGIGGEWGNGEEWRRVLLSIQDNKNIEDGSMVLIASVGAGNLLLKKDAGVLRVEFIESIIDAEKQTSFINRYLASLKELRQADLEGGSRIAGMLRCMESSST